jgi:hypothetical protein
MGFGGKLLLVVLSAGRAFFRAVVEIVWGIAGFFLLAVLLKKFNADSSTITGLISVIALIQNNWLYFFGILFIWEFLMTIPKSPSPIQEVKKGTKL